jgi:hypothetical protein
MAEDDIAFLNLTLLIGALVTKKLEAAEGAGERDRNEALHRAREAIDMVSALKIRTTGRLKPEEAKVLDTMLGEFQTRYVRATAKRPAR